MRLGHRLVRDERISTHIGLVARAFGAQQLIMTGAEDRTIDSIQKVGQRWGGDFKVSYVKNWREVAKNWEGIVVHLTMYGEPIDRALPMIVEKARETHQGNILLVIGAEKVPAEIYSIADFNVAVGNQPHSEVAALAVFLDRLFMGAELYHTFAKAKFRIIPSLRGKGVENISEN